MVQMHLLFFCVVAALAIEMGVWWLMEGRVEAVVCFLMMIRRDTRSPDFSPVSPFALSLMSQSWARDAVGSPLTVRSARISESNRQDGGRITPRLCVTLPEA